MVRTVVAAYLDVLCVLNLLSSDASLLCGADQDTCHVPLPSLLEEISPPPLLVPISLPAAVHISPVGDCRHRGLSDRGCQLVVCTSLRRESERKHGGGRERGEIERGNISAVDDLLAVSLRNEVPLARCL